jgi:hypothetical protein
MKTATKFTLPLALLVLAGCASAPKAPPPRYVPYAAPAHPRHHPRPKKPRHKHPAPTAGRRHLPHRAPPAGAEAEHAPTAPGRNHAAEKKAKPQRPVVLYANDAALAEQVNAALKNDPALRGTHIQVRAYQGNIGLAGQVANAAQKDHAVAVAGNVTGVKMVSDQLTLAH